MAFYEPFNREKTDPGAVAGWVLFVLVILYFGAHVWAAL